MATVEEGMVTVAVEKMAVATAHNFGEARNNLDCWEELRKTSVAG